MTPPARTVAEDQQPSAEAGSAAAAILSTGIGCFLLGALAVLADASKPFARSLTWYRPTGPLSGVTSLAILIWLVLWFSLAALWRRKPIGLRPVLAAACAFLALGILLTFPPFADLLLK
jgi:hypothetical protein